MSDIDIKYFDQAKDLLEKGYLNKNWTVEQLAQKLSEQNQNVNKNRPVGSSTVFNSKPNSPPPLSQRAIDMGIKPNQEQIDSSN